MELHTLLSSINAIGSWLAKADIISLQDIYLSPVTQRAGQTDEPCDPKDRVIVLCGSAILPTAEAVFENLVSGEKGGEDNTVEKLAASTLVICGGKGHSTVLLYDAAKSRREYRSSFHDETELNQMAESEILYRILTTCYKAKFEEFLRLGGKVLVENRSTNCGANAVETRRTLEKYDGSELVPKEIVVIQDPTMARRTCAGFEKAYYDHIMGLKQPKIICCPTFIPLLALSSSAVSSTASSAPDQSSIPINQQLQSFCFSTSPPVSASQLWTLPRFLDLLVGEVPRLRDDENGYGPKGKGFIGHVDISKEVESAWERLREAIGGGESRAQVVG